MKTKILKRMGISSDPKAPNHIELALVEQLGTGRQAVVAFDHSHNQVMSEGEHGPEFARITDAGINCVAQWLSPDQAAAELKRELDELSDLFG